jgi:hypothetical protein
MTEPQFRVRKGFVTPAQRFKRGTKGVPHSAFAGQLMSAEAWCDRGYLSPMAETQAEITLPKNRKALQTKLADLQVQYLQCKFVKPLFDAIALCSRENMSLPPWVRQAFLAGYSEIEGKRTRSLDKSFGKLLPSGAQIGRAKNEPGMDDRVVQMIFNLLSEEGCVVEVKQAQRHFPSFKVPPNIKGEYWFAGCKTEGKAIKFASKYLGVGEDRVKKLWYASETYQQRRRDLEQGKTLQNQ